MPELTIRPTAKFVKAGAICAAVLAVAAGIAYLSLRGETAPAWPAALFLLILLWPAKRWVQRRFIKTVITGDRMHHETGVFSRSTRNIQLSKVQDVRVDQRLTQRLFDVGDLGVETAGETSRLTLRDIDSPQALADEIMQRAQKWSAAGGRPSPPVV